MRERSGAILDNEPGRSKNQAMDAWLRAAILIVAIGALAPHGLAQAVPKRTAEQLKASYEAHKGDFDYLLGERAFTSVSKE